MDYGVHQVTTLMTNRVNITGPTSYGAPTLGAHFGGSIMEMDTRLAATQATVEADTPYDSWPILPAKWRIAPR
jgi:hypothetical protein